MTPTSDATPLKSALMPDWSLGVNLSFVFMSAVKTGRRGLEQRSRRRQEPIVYLEYTRTGLTPQEAQNRQENIRAEFRSPLIVPIWPDGIGINAQVSAGVAFLKEFPSSDWKVPADLYFWHPVIGGQWRTCTSIIGKLLILSGTGTVFPAGTWVFPSRLMLREAEEGSLKQVDVESGEEKHRYRTL